MSSTTLAGHRSEQRTWTLPREPDEGRGAAGMWLVIATEAMLFVVLFFAYFQLGHGDPRWLQHEPPKLPLAFVMLAVLLTSSAVLHWGERALRREQSGTARVATAITVALGAVFLLLQGLEYRDHLKTLTPQSNAYGSIFYTITSIHGLHVLVGTLMLGYVLLQPDIGRTRRRPHRPLHVAAMYWHFVDAVWVVIVALLYVVPNLR